MIQIIAGEKGRGKTKILIDRANASVREAKGSVVYLDKSNKHMYELSNKIRLINVRDYQIANYNEFIGFISGLIASNHDLEVIYLDSFLKLANPVGSDVDIALEKLQILAEKFKVSVVISISMDKLNLPDAVKESVVVAL